MMFAHMDYMSSFVFKTTQDHTLEKQVFFLERGQIQKYIRLSESGLCKILLRQCCPLFQSQ